MKVLIIGSGGREHALAYAATKSPSVEHVFVAPGNAGTAHEANMSNVDISVSDIAGLKSFAVENGIDLTIVGPEQPLVDGVVDEFQKDNLRIFGPTAKASQLEGSKAYSKAFLEKYNIPTAAYQCFSNKEQAISYIKQQGAPIVIKADGLAAGKGVIVAMDEQTAIDAVEDMLAGNKFGEAGHRVVIEEFLDGEEASFIVIADGDTALPFATSQDHKRAFNGDKGPNTGGMGAYSPAPVVTQEVYQRVMTDVINPTMKGMQMEGAAYTGFLYAGLMITASGEPKVIEFNCRFGDPETQPIMMRLESDLVELCDQAIDGKLSGKTIQFKDEVAIGVVLAAGGYPEQYRKGDEIKGLAAVDQKNTKVFHAGTRTYGELVLTNGGRVLCVTSLGKDIASAQKTAYDAINGISFENMQFRTDIAYRAIARKA
ncbi:MAG: phosphoribosylamine--glycine ligase [Aestuariibacter sp.]